MPKVCLPEITHSLEYGTHIIIGEGFHGDRFSDFLTSKNSVCTLGNLHSAISVDKMPIKAPRAPELLHRLMTETSRHQQFLSWRSIHKRTKSLGTYVTEAEELQLPPSNGLWNYNSRHWKGWWHSWLATHRMLPPTSSLFSGPAHTLKIYHIFLLLSLILLEDSILGSFSEDSHLSKCPCQTQSLGYLCTLAAILQASVLYNWKRRSRHSEQRGEFSAWSPLNGPRPSLVAFSSASLMANGGLFPPYECLGWVLCSSRVLPPFSASRFAIFPACAVQRSPGVERGVLGNIKKKTSR